MEGSNKQLRVLEELVGTFKEIKTGLDAVLKKGLQTLVEYVDCDRAAIFLLEKTEQIYRSRYIIDKKGLIALEETISLEASDKELRAVINGERTYLVANDGTLAYIPLHGDKKIIGLVRIDNMANKKSFTDEQIKLSQEFVSKFEISVESALLQERNQALTDELLILSRINASLVRTMDLSETLEIILKNMVKHLGVDRVKLFLIDSEKNMLNGKIAVDMRGAVQSIEEYKYPLKTGINELVDVLYSKRVDDIRNKPVINIPIKIKDEYLGVLSVDNVFSKQIITREDEKYIMLFANNIAITIENIRLAKRMEEASIVDALTKLYVQRYFHQRLGEEMARARRFKQEMSLMLIDVDHFKVYNDTYGHPVGDSILVELAKLILHNTREVDFAARYEGDGVIMILPNTPRDGARAVASRVRQLIEAQGFIVPNGVINITGSVGVATFPGDTDSKEELLKMTEEALNWAKTHGRNQVCLFSECF